MQPFQSVTLAVLILIADVVVQGRAYHKWSGSYLAGVVVWFGGACGGKVECRVPKCGSAELPTLPQVLTS